MKSLFVWLILLATGFELTSAADAGIRRFCLHMAYYKLICQTCKETFPSVVATSREELLVPDYERAAEQSGPLNSERLRDFHNSHGAHSLTTRKVS